MSQFHPLEHILECVSSEKTTGRNYRIREKKCLSICMVIIGLTMLLELFGGLWTHSLALLSDAAHMFSHLFSLGASFIAIWIATREADEVRSYGFYRAEILAALFNGVTLFVIVLWIFYDAVFRFLNPAPIATTEMLVIAVIGLVVNLVSAYLLRGVCGKDLNLKSAFMHMLADTLSSVGIIAAGILIHYTGKMWLDPLASVLIAAMILRWSLQLTKDAVHILLESTPKHLNKEEIVSAIQKEVPEIHRMHHIHMWELTSHLCAFTAHVEIDDVPVSQSEELRKRINTVLREGYHITHTNLQFECRKN